MIRTKWLGTSLAFTAAMMVSASALGQTLYEGARIITGDGSVIENGAFVVNGALFTQVGRKGEVPLPQGGTRVDLTGKTVMPTLVDLHGHLGFQDLANGRMSKEMFNHDNLVDHLQRRTDVQNIDLMNLAGFCRNCLSNWMKEAADAKGVPLTKDESRTIVYGVPYEEWKAKHQNEASPESRAAFDKAARH